MNRETFKEIHSGLRRDRFRCPPGTVGNLWFRPFGLVLCADRDHDNPRRFYLRLTCQQGAAKSDRLFYVKRARAIRMAGFRSVHP